MPSANRKALHSTNARALENIAKRFKLHLRLAREMRLDGYLRIIPEIPITTISKKSYTHANYEIGNICSYYGISSDKIVPIYNEGYLETRGLDYKSAISRYLQRHSGQLSVRLLCYLACDETRPKGGVVKDKRALACLSSLKIQGKLQPPMDLRPYLDAACKGQSEALERVARWMRNLIESVGEPRRWAFYGVRLALIEGSHDVWFRPFPKLRKLKKHRKLAKLLREHPLLRGCVTPVTKPGRNSQYFYMFHRPGEFWDL